MRKVLQSLTAGLLFLSIPGPVSYANELTSEGSEPDVVTQESSNLEDASSLSNNESTTGETTATQDEESTTENDTTDSNTDSTSNEDLINEADSTTDDNGNTVNENSCTDIEQSQDNTEESTMDTDENTTEDETIDQEESTLDETETSEENNECLVEIQTELPNEELLAKIASTSTHYFKDIGTSYRAADEIYYLASGGIVYGTTPDMFSPDRKVTRAEAAAMIGRALSLNGTRKSTIFPDVGSGNFASGYIQAAVDKKIISGYNDGTFKPDQPVTRGEMAIMISKAFTYGDATIQEATETLMEKGISDGLPDGTFGSHLHIIRADFSVFLARGILVDLRSKPTETFDEDMFVIATDLNVRTGPGTLFPKIALLQPMPVKIAYQIGDWYYVTWEDGKTGFVYGEYLSTNPDDTVDTIDKILRETHIIIDPGHGSPDPGADGFGIYEKDVVLDVGNKLKAYLEQTPLTVSMTRETDRKIELADRVSFAEQQGGDMFVSIHTNAFNGSANGTETYYYRTASTNPYTSESRALALYIQNRLIEAWNLNDRGIKHGNFHVLRENTMPAVLVELGFIDNKGDNQKISSPAERQKAAKAMFFGILDYYYHYEGLDIGFLYTEMNGTPSKRLH
ncbi:hypothetical protein GCM10008967_02750 [Bacillus carboniphilus]|uniref:N-acetylmuramoyl-L-alanine amidase n=1 Tax=Bacillus carboniphilus TaxID=86663 RepID=A0ABN0VRQ0_9BACI